MIKLQFKDLLGRLTEVSFNENGNVIVLTKKNLEEGFNKHVYTKESPIAAMYQRLLHDSREVGPNLYQVVGAW